MPPSNRLRDAARAMRDECLGMRVRQLNRRVTRIYDAALRPLGIGTAQLNVLVALALMGEARATDIGAALGIEKSTLSRNLERLAARGWIENASGAADTVQRLRLTTAGARVVEDSLPAWRAAQRRAAAELPAELVRALRRGPGVGTSED